MSIRFDESTSTIAPEFQELKERDLRSQQGGLGYVSEPDNRAAAVAIPEVGSEVQICFLGGDPAIMHQRVTTAR